MGLFLGAFFVADDERFWKLISLLQFEIDLKQVFGIHPYSVLLRNPLSLATKTTSIHTKKNNSETKHCTHDQQKRAGINFYIYLFTRAHAAHCLAFIMLHTMNRACTYTCNIYLMRGRLEGLVVPADVAPHRVALGVLLVVTRGPAGRRRRCRVVAQHVLLVVHRAHRRRLQFRALLAVHQLENKYDDDDYDQR